MEKTHVREAIKSIIEEIPSGKIFDSHYIINRLIKRHSDKYLLFASTINAPKDKTLVVHGKIGQEINTFSKSIVRPLNQESWSENIHGNPSECACWEKR